MLRYSYIISYKTTSSAIQSLQVFYSNYYFTSQASREAFCKASPCNSTQPYTYLCHYSMYNQDAPRDRISNTFPDIATCTGVGDVENTKLFELTVCTSTNGALLMMYPPC